MECDWVVAGFRHSTCRGRERLELSFCGAAAGDLGSKEGPRPSFPYPSKHRQDDLNEISHLAIHVRMMRKAALCDLADAGKAASHVRSSLCSPPAVPKASHCLLRLGAAARSKEEAEVLGTPVPSFRAFLGCREAPLCWIWR